MGENFKYLEMMIFYFLYISIEWAAFSKDFFYILYLYLWTHNSYWAILLMQQETYCVSKIPLKQLIQIKGFKNTFWKVFNEKKILCKSLKWFVIKYIVYSRLINPILFEIMAKQLIKVKLIKRWHLSNFNLLIISDNYKNSQILLLITGLILFLLNNKKVCLT